MRSACPRLQAKGTRCSCQTAFTVERDTLTRVGTSRPSSMGPTSSIPHGKRLYCEDCSHWLELSAAGVDGVAGLFAGGPLRSPSECEVMALGVFDCTRSIIRSFMGLMRACGSWCG